MRAGGLLPALLGGAMAVMASRGVGDRVKYKRLMDRAGYVLGHAGGDPGRCEEAALLYHEALEARPRSAEAKAGEERAEGCAKRSLQRARPTLPR